MNFQRKVPKPHAAFAAIILFAAALTVQANANAQTSLLPSWNDGSAKQAIVSFVKEVTNKSVPTTSSPRIALPLSIKMAPFGSNILCMLRLCLR